MQNHTEQAREILKIEPRDTRANEIVDSVLPFGSAAIPFLAGQNVSQPPPPKVSLPDTTETLDAFEVFVPWLRNLQTLGWTTSRPSHEAII